MEYHLDIHDEVEECVNSQLLYCYECRKIVEHRQVTDRRDQMVLKESGDRSYICENGHARMCGTSWEDERGRGGGRKPSSPERDEEMVEALQGGASVREVATSFNVTIWVVYAALRRTGISKRSIEDEG